MQFCPCHILRIQWAAEKPFFNLISYQILAPCNLGENKNLFKATYFQFWQPIKPQLVPGSDTSRFSSSDESSPPSHIFFVCWQWWCWGGCHTSHACRERGTTAGSVVPGTKGEAGQKFKGYCWGLAWVSYRKSITPTPPQLYTLAPEPEAAVSPKPSTLHTKAKLLLQKSFLV